MSHVPEKRSQILDGITPCFPDSYSVLWFPEKGFGKLLRKPLLPQILVVADRSSMGYLLSMIIQMLCIV